MSEREGNVFNTDRSRMPAHDFLDFSITYQPNDKDWQASLYVKNIRDNVFIGTWAAASALQGGALNLQLIQIQERGEYHLAETFSKLRLKKEKVGFPAFFLSLKNIYKIYMQFISIFAIICPNLDILKHFI